MGLENKEAVWQFDLLTAACDAEALEDVCTPNLVNHALAPHRAPGLEGTKEFLRECRASSGRAAWMRAMMDDQDVVTIAEGDYVIQFGTRSGRWPGGPFREFDIPAGSYRYDVAFMYRLEAGRIAERWAIRDDLAMIQQLGGRPAPPDTDRTTARHQRKPSCDQRAQSSPAARIS